MGKSNLETGKQIYCSAIPYLVLLEDYKQEPFNCVFRGMNFFPMPSYAALYAFSCELLIKSIYLFECDDSSIPLRGHKLQKLFRNLKVKTQIEIADNTKTVDKIPGTFSDRLANVSDMFTTLRYDFENEDLSIDYVFIVQFAKSLEEVAFVKMNETL